MNLRAWKVAMDLVKDVYEATKNYPAEERYGLTSQTRRAAVSIPANIAEGIGRNHNKDTIQFLYVSRGSAYELETLLRVASEIGILSGEIFQKLSLKIEIAVMVLNGLIKYFLGKTDRNQKIKSEN